MDVKAVCLVFSTFAVLASCHQACFFGSEYDPKSGRTRWFLSTNDPCSCSAIRVGGVNVGFLTPPYLQGAPFYLDQIVETEDCDFIEEFFGCGGGECVEPGPLGLEDGTIPDHRITASSSYDGNEPWRGRLGGRSSWLPLSGTFAGCWIQVDLGERTVVTGVITQGGPGAYSTSRVTAYQVAYRTESSSTLQHVTNVDGNFKVFVGNTDVTPDDQVTNTFEPSIEASVVRIFPDEWTHLPKMRLELLGCRV